MQEQISKNLENFLFWCYFEGMGGKKMNIIQQVEAVLREEYRTGQTQEEIAKTHHVRQSQVQQLLSGKRTVAGLSLETFCKMFPRATVNLSGDVNTATADRGSTAIANAGSNNNFLTDRNAAVADYRLKAMDAVLALDLPPDATNAVLRALKDIK